MKCTKCGYDDNGTGDTAHVCDPVDVAPTSDPKTRFDLEQELLECWKVVDDIKMFTKQSATDADWQALSLYYERKFTRLWETFEELCRTRQI